MSKQIVPIAAVTLCCSVGCIDGLLNHPTSIVWENIGFCGYVLISPTLSVFDVNLELVWRQWFTKKMNIQFEQTFLLCTNLLHVPAPMQGSHKVLGVNDWGVTDTRSCSLFETEAIKFSCGDDISFSPKKVTL